jgi:hypothetical protein
MGEQPSSEDDQLFGAIDLIINVLKQHEAKLDSFVEKLEKINEKVKECPGAAGNIDKIGEKIDIIEKQLATLKQLRIENAQNQTVPAEPLPANQNPPASTVTQPPQHIQNRSIILQCNHWSDFQSLAANADFVSFSYEEVKKLLRVDAVKDNEKIIYIGELSKLGAPLKSWLAKQLNVPEGNILEGSLSV